MVLGAVLAAVAGLALAQEPAVVPAVVIAERVTVQPGANLLDLARAHGLGYVEMMAANPGHDPWNPSPDRPVLLPTLHLPPDSDAELVVNLGDMRLYHRGPGGQRTSHPIGIGREGWEVTPGVVTAVIRKRENPAWVPPPSIRAEKPWLPEVVPAGPDNPLGAYSLDLGLGLIRIHGTNRPDGVGRRVSHGCIRLYPEDIAALFPQVAVGTRVAILDQPAKLAWLEGELWLEIHPSQSQADAVESRRPPPATALPGLEARVTAAAGPAAPRVDWGLVAWAEQTRLGVPVRITRPAAGAPLALAPEPPSAPQQKKGPEDMPPGP